jgi:hypothetical protein
LQDLRGRDRVWESLAERHYDIANVLTDIFFAFPFAADGKPETEGMRHATPVSRARMYTERSILNGSVKLCDRSIPHLFAMSKFLCTEAHRMSNFAILIDRAQK